VTPNQFALIISYYLSRFDKEALTNLGFESFNEAFEFTAKKLGVKKNYVKLRRDEFDYVYPWRRGWQRPMDRQIIKTIEAFQDIDEPDLREIVLNVLNNADYKESEEAEKINDLIEENKKTRKKDKQKRKSVFILRGPTGKKAEDFFIKYFNQKKFPVPGKLIDKRDFGGGYDFEIQNSNLTSFIEVKGMIDISGGILFTNKEWLTAQKEKDKYYLVIVKSLNTKPIIKIIQNPAAIFNPQKSIYTTLQIQWSISKEKLNPNLSF
jgi:hypothetical protein